MSFWDSIWKSGVGGAAGSLGPLGAFGAAFGPALFGGLFGANDPNAKARQQYLDLLSPSRIAGLTNTFYNQNINSPAFSVAGRAANAGAMNLTNNLNRNFAQRGIFHSGVGSIAPALAQSSLGNQMANLYSGAWQNASQQGMGLAERQAQGIAGMPTAPNYSANLFAGGLNSFLPFLARYGQPQRQQTQFNTGFNGGQPLDIPSLIAMLQGGRF